MADFKERFDLAIRSPKFHELEGEQKKLFVNRLFDEDERTAALDLTQREAFMGKYFEENPPPEPRPETTFAEDFTQSPLVNMMIPGAKQTIDPEGRVGELLNTMQGVPFLGPLATDVVGGVAGAGAAGLQGAHNAARFFAGPGMTAEGPGEESMGWVDDFGKFTEVVNLIAATAPSAHDGVSSHEDVKLFEKGGLRRAADWLGGGIGQTAGYVLPAVAFSAATGGSSFIPFAAILTGEQVRGQLEETGRYGDPALNAVSGAVQAAAERLVGPESMVGKNLFRDGIRKAMDTGAARFSTRLTTHGIGEAATEGFQEYVNQQVAEWSAGDKGWWENLEPEDKLAVKEGLILGGIIGGMFAVPSTMKQTAIGDKVGFVNDILEGLQTLSPEERGAAGFIASPRAVRELTEDDINKAVAGYAPDFLTEEQATEFVNGTLDPAQFTEEQQAELATARAESEAAIAPKPDESVQPVPQEQLTERENNALDEVRALSMVKIQNLQNEGNTEGAAQVQEALDSLELVEGVVEELRTIQGFAERFGGTLNFFRAKNGSAIGSNGVSVGTNGDILVRWDASAPQAVAAVALHEVIHVIGKNDPEALSAMYDAVVASNPELAKQMESWLREQYAENGQTLTDQDLKQETVAYMGQSNAIGIFRALQMESQNYDFAKPRGPIKKLLDGFRDIVRRTTRKLPRSREIFGPGLDKEFDNSTKAETTQLLGQFISYLKTGENVAEPLAFQADNFGRRGRTKLDIEEAPVPQPRAPSILLDEAPPRTPTVLEDTGKRAGKRKPLDIEQVEPPKPRGEALIVGEEPKIEEETRKAEQKPLLKTPSKPAQVKLGAKPVEAVRTPRTPRLLLDEPITRTTASRLEVGDQLEVDNELVSVTKSEAKGNKRIIHYVDQEGNTSIVTVAPNKRFMKFEGEQAQPDLFEEGKKVTGEQLSLALDRMEEEVAAVEKIASDTNFSLAIRPYEMTNEMTTGMDADRFRRLMTIDEEIVHWMKYQPPGVVSYILEDETGLRGFAILRERYQNNPEWPNDREVYFEYIAATFDKKGKELAGDDRYQELGIRNVLALGPELARMYPQAIWAGGDRIGGIRRDYEEQGKETYTRVPIYRTKEDKPSWWEDGMVSEGSLPQSELQRRHGYTATHGRSYAEASEAQRQMVSENREALAALEEPTQELSEDELRAHLGIETDAVRHAYDNYMTISEEELGDLEASLREVDPDGDKYAERARIDAAEQSRQQADEDPDTYFSFSNDEDKPLSEFTSADWNALGKKHGVDNLGGMGKMVDIGGGLEIPGGVDGTFTYEELLWLKHQAIDTYLLDRDTHQALHRKIVRTMQPDQTDTLQTLNHFIFSMLSPNQPLTPNELSYAVVRVRTDEESKAFAEMIPWDVMAGESPTPETYDKYDKDNKEVAEFIEAAYKSAETNRRLKRGDKTRVNRKSIDWIRENRPGGHGFNKWYRNYYNSKIARHFNLQAKEKGGLGLLGTAEMANIAEMNQFYQSDPDWFVKQNAIDGTGPTSWHTYVERLGSQFRGMATKVASFAAVWQDPVGAAISAVDRHMGRIYEPALFPTPQERLDWERGVINDWNKSDAAKKEGKLRPKIVDGEIVNFDELFMRPGGDSHFVKAIMEKMKPSKSKLKGGRNLSPFWKRAGDVFLKADKDFIVNQMSKHYKAALEINAERAEELGMGLFATQWFEWDRYRRRLEPHEVNFPGLYKLPHLADEQIASSLKAHSDAGYLAGTKEKVPVLDSEGKPTESVDIRMKPVKTAPLGSLNYHSFSEGPGHFPPGQGFRTSLFNMHQADPLSGVSQDSGPMWGLPDQSWMSYLRNKFQDKFYRVRQLQEEIEKRHGSIHEDMDAYLTEMLYHGKAADQVEKFEKQYVDPLLDYLHKDKVSIPDFERWLHARHAGERNDHLDEIWENRKRKVLTRQIADIENQIAYAEDQGIDTTVLKRRRYRRKKELANLKKNIHHAGMSSEDAARILEEEGTKFDEAAKLFDRMMDQKLKILHEAGMITDKQLKRVSIYKHYVPLKGKEFKGDLEEILEDAGIHTGQGFDIRGDEIGFSFGRVGETQHTRPILAQAVVDIEEAIVRAEKNRVGQSFLALVKEFKNDDLYQVNTTTKKRVWDPKTGTVRLVEDAFANRKDNVVAVKEGGKTHYIDIIDARLASAMKNLGSGQMSAAVKILAAINRFMAAVNTTYNPEFIIANLVRDVQTAGFNMSTEELSDLRGETFKNIPAAINGIRKAEGLTLKPDEEVAKDKWVQYYLEYVEDGGKIGFFGYTDVHSKARHIQKKVERAGNVPLHTTFSTIQAIGDFVSSANSSVENATRLSAYIAARKAGISRKKAAGLGRNLTVNFNKKGDASQTLNALYLFANASIQGTFRMGQAVLTSPRVRKMVGAQIMASFGMALMNRGIGGDDEEDGFPWWEKIGDWQKERSFIVMLPGGNGEHIKIPLPYGYNVFHVIGTELAEIAFSTANGTMTPERAVRSSNNIFASMMTAFNPMGGVSLDTKWQSLRFLVPSAFAPIADTLVNETYYGAPVHPVRSSWDHSPDSQRYFKSVNPLAQGLTEYLNRWTGGSEYESGWVDLNPENLEYIVGAYAGAGAKTGVRAVFTDTSWLWKAINGEDTSKYEANDIAFLRRVYGESNDYTAAAIFYENIEGLSQGEEAYKNLEGQDRRDWKEQHGWMVPLFKKLSDAEKDIRATDDTDAKNKARKRFNKAYREAWLSQF